MLDREKAVYMAYMLQTALANKSARAVMLAEYGTFGVEKAQQGVKELAKMFDFPDPFGN